MKMIHRNGNVLMSVLGLTLLAACGPKTPSDQRFASTDPAGGGECTVCHGSAVNAAPPGPVRRSGPANPFAIGAHQAHLQSEIAIVRCSECHQIPRDVMDHHPADAEGHASVVFGPLARADGANPVWDRTTGTCGNVYCHGSTLPSSNHFNPVWSDASDPVARNSRQFALMKIQTSVQSRSDCLTCHGDGISGRTLPAVREGVAPFHRFNASR